jgi:tuberculosinol/isotuberculosinol synthase
MDAEAFRDLETEQIARLVHQAGSKVCVFPINGTRRWFLLEHPPQPGNDFADVYLDVVGRRHVELYRLLFDHGLETLLTPVFGPELLTRGDGYMQMAVEGLTRLVQGSAFRDFYQAYQVRVRFYGDHRKFFGPTPYAYLSDLFDEVTARTATHDRYRLFYGVCAQDPVETAADLAVRYHAEHGRVPDRQTLVALYYGELVPPVSLFIGFDRFWAFDMPLIATGEEDLYFTVSPSPYLTERQLRDILYDHLYARRGDEPDYAALGPESRSLMRDFYRANVGKTLGIGARHQRTGFWYPQPQVELPGRFAEAADTLGA